MQKFIRCVLSLAFVLILTNCSTNHDPSKNPSGFLPNYSLLKPVPSPDGTEIYSYKAPDANRSDYHAIFIESVALYQTATKNGVTNQQIESARIGISEGVQKVVSRKLPITNAPGNGVAKLNVAITGAILEGDGFKPRYIIPISAAIKLASMATGLDNKQPVLIVELKITDSKTNKLLKETVSVIKGEKFRTGNSAEKFQQLAITWVEEALKYTEPH